MKFPAKTSNVFLYPKNVSFCAWNDYHKQGSNAGMIISVDSNNNKMQNCLLVSNAVVTKLNPY